MSTSGYPFKYPGRVGDSAMPGAGNYCDLRYGAAACTGRGELSMRATGARHIVERLAAGDDPGAGVRRDARRGRRACPTRSARSCVRWPSRRTAGTAAPPGRPARPTRC